MRASPRWRKLEGDVRHAAGRLATMVAAIALGVFATAAVATAYQILGREISRGYLATNPPSALLDVEGLSPAVVEAAREFAGIADAEAGGRVRGRVEVAPGEWLPLLLFVVPDFVAARIGTVRLESGRWPAAAGEVALERTALSLARTALGQGLEVAIPGAGHRRLRVTAVVHDASLAPAWQEQVVYGYLSGAALAALGEADAPHVLKVTVSDPGGGAAAVERVVAGLARSLAAGGHASREIRIPPRRHPHAAQMTNVVRMLLVFGVLTLILGAIVTAVLCAGLLAPQARELAVMKAIGASSAQVLGLYAALLAAVGALAAAIGIPLGVAAGRALAALTATMLNLELADASLPYWLYGVLLAAGVVLPLAAALVPLRAAAVRPVRVNLGATGASLAADVPAVLHGAGAALARFDGALGLALRNSVRRRARTMLTVALLSCAGAMFITALNVRAAWRGAEVAAAAERPYDAELRLSRAEPSGAVLAVVTALPGVAAAEPWSRTSAARARDDGLAIVATYPDGGHGSLALESVPADTRFVRPQLATGRWLVATDVDGAVLNEQALAMFPDAVPGVTLRLAVGGQRHAFRLLGVVREHLSPATAYVTPAGFGAATGERGRTRGVRLALNGSDAPARQSALDLLEDALEQAGMGVDGSASRDVVARALGGHLRILIFTLVTMALLMAAVGALGLAAAVSAGVVERAREFGILRALGASRGVVARVVIGESVLVASLGILGATLLSLPLTAAVATVVGTASLGPRLAAVLSPLAVPTWALVGLFTGVLAALAPTWRASRLTIRDTLDSH